MKYRKCKICEKEFPETNFSLKKYKKKNGEIVSYGNNCINCLKIRAKINYQNNKDKLLLVAAEYRKNNRYKIISKMKEYNARHDVKERLKKYRKINKEKLNIQNKEWHKNNPEKSKIIKKRKEKKLRKKDVYKLRAHVSRQINFALYRSGSSKCGESVLKYLPYTIKELKQHIEKQFEPWMNWNNYGIYTMSTWDDLDTSTWTWQIDHIVPQCKLPYDSMTHDNFKKCWALNNLRPLSAKQNCLDGARKNED